MADQMPLDCVPPDRQDLPFGFLHLVLAKGRNTRVYGFAKNRRRMGFAYRDQFDVGRFATRSLRRRDYPSTDRLYVGGNA